MLKWLSDWRLRRNKKSIVVIQRKREDVNRSHVKWCWEELHKQTHQCYEWHRQEISTKNTKRLLWKREMLQMKPWKTSADPVFTVNMQCWWMERSAVTLHPLSVTEFHFWTEICRVQGKLRGRREDGAFFIFVALCQQPCSYVRKCNTSYKNQNMTVIRKKTGYRTCHTLNIAALPTVGCQVL